MSHRGMNNTEKAAAAMLKKEGFHVFYQESHNGTKGNWYATHEKLIGQYHIPTGIDQALENLRKKNNQSLNNLS